MQILKLEIVLMLSKINTALSDLKTVNIQVLMIPMQTMKIDIDSDFI